MSLASPTPGGDLPARASSRIVQRADSSKEGAGGAEGPPQTSSEIVKDTTQSRPATGIEFLTKLPSELLILVFENLWTVPSPICKTLLPFERMSNFKTLSVQNPVQLERLSQLLVTAPHLGEHCKSLQFGQMDQKAGTEINISKRFTQLVGHLKRVTDISLRRNLQMAFLICSEEVTGGHLQSIEKLRLCINAEDLIDLVGFAREEGEEEPDELHINWKSLQILQNLRLYPNLRTVDLEFNGERLRFPDSPYKPKLSEPLRNITELRLREELGIKGAIRIFQEMPNLLHLYLMPSNFKGKHYNRLLKHCPKNLISLGLQDLAGVSSFAGNREGLICIDEVMMRFTLLQSLELSLPYFSPRLFQSLNKFKFLSKLYLGIESYDVVDQQDLFNLIDPQSGNYHPQLKDLTLDFINACIGIKQYVVKLDIYTGYPDLWDWDLPLWDPGRMDRKGMNKFVRLCRAQGVRVRGSIFEAFEVEDAHGREVKRAKKIWREGGHTMESIEVIRARTRSG